MKEPKFETMKKENKRRCAKWLKEIAKSLEFQPYHPKDHDDADDAFLESRAEIGAGCVLKLKNGTLELVGTVNALLGVCDDCTRFEHKDIKAIAFLGDVK